MAEAMIKYRVSKYSDKDGLRTVREIRVTKETEKFITLERSGRREAKSGYNGEVFDTKDDALAYIVMKRNNELKRFLREAEVCEERAKENRLAAAELAKKIAANPAPAWEQVFSEKSGWWD